VQVVVDVERRDVGGGDNGGEDACGAMGGGGYS
jgi:hypothetical protein